MANNILTAYLNDGFEEDFITDLIDYIKSKPGTVVVSRGGNRETNKRRDVIRIERKNHLNMYGGTAYRLDPPEPGVTVQEYGDQLCNIVDNIM